MGKRYFEHMVLVVVGAFGVWGCDDEPAEGTPPVVIGADMSPDAAEPDPDAGVIDAEVDAEVDAEPVPDMALPPVEWPEPSADGVPTEVVIETWMRSILPLADDPLRGPYERGEIVYPELGEAADGTRWYALPSGEDGTIQDFGISEGYAVGLVPVPPGHALLVRADRSTHIYSRFSVQPGDVYAHGNSLFPVVTDPRSEETVIAIRAMPRRGAPRITVFTTPDQIVFNPGDLTFSDLRVGHADEDWLGVPVLETRGAAVGQVTARVVESEHWNATEVDFAGLPAGASSQVGFRLSPKAPWAEAEVEIPIELEISSPDLSHDYRRTITLTTRPAEGAYRQSFRSPIDGSIQYYGVNPPPAVDPEVDSALILSLHGAGVEAIGQARAYAAKDWGYIIAPTNRRRFGFDWEEWGRFNALAALDDAQARFAIDPTQVYLTGHSMGGHGTWHVGVTTPGRFAVYGPSAGWASFETYVGAMIPDGLFGRARAHSRTFDYISNLARRAVYIIHGDADNNVPVSEGRTMFERVGMVTEDIEYHEQPGAGHWWNAGVGPATDCVDWPPMFEMMQNRRLDPHELDFEFRSPNPGYSPQHSVVWIDAADSPLEDVVVRSSRADDAVVMQTENVRRMLVDGAALLEAGVASLEVDGDAVALEADWIAWGPETLRTAELHGPFTQAFRRPFCFVRPDPGTDRADAWRRVAGFWASYWQIIGNGHACGVPESQADAARAAGYNLVRMGSAADVMLPIEGVPIEWDGGGVTLDGAHQPESSMVMVQRDGDRLGAALVAAEGVEHLLLRLIPFSSSGGLPDYFVYADRGGLAAGFFDSDWRWDPAFVVP